MARPTKINRDLIDNIAGHISNGVTPEVAAQVEGINPATYYRWINKGKDDTKGLFYEFCEAITQARTLMRAKIELTLAETDPRFFATRSPIMREQSDVPGWHNFEKQQQLQVNVVTVSSIIDDAIEALPEPANILELPNLDDKDIHFIGENGHKNGHEQDTDKVG